MPESPPPHTLTPGADAQHLGEGLAPALREACGGRLGSIEFFRSPFQHGGAATGFSRWTCADGSVIPAMVKLPVGHNEFRWNRAIGTFDDLQCEEARTCPIPRLLKGGMEVGGHDFAWIVVERLSSPGVIARPQEKHLHEILETLVEFQVRADAHSPVSGTKASPNWEKLLERSRAVAKEGIVDEPRKWNDAIHRVQRALPILKAKWESRAINSWCHGDLHLGNLLHRTDLEGVQRSVLVDLALVHPGHWVEDAIYLERQYWGHSELLQGIKPATELARLRRARGLNANDNYPELCNVRRVLMAACVPAAAEREANPKYVHAALEMLERSLPQVAR